MTTLTPLTLSVLPQRLAVCRFGPEATIPAWATIAPFFSVTRTVEELSIVCPENHIPLDVPCERDWQALKLEGPFEFSLVGILAAVAAPLAEAGVSVFAIATYDTDYVLVRESQFEQAVSVLRAAGHTVLQEDL